MCPCCYPAREGCIGVPSLLALGCSLELVPSTSPPLLLKATQPHVGQVMGPAKQGKELKAEASPVPRGSSADATETQGGFVPMWTEHHTGNHGIPGAHCKEALQRGPSRWRAGHTPSKAGAPRGTQFQPTLRATGGESLGGVRQPCSALSSPLWEGPHRPGPVGRASRRAPPWPEWGLPERGSGR